MQAERLKQLEEEEALSECVFKPEISRMAQTLKALEVEVGAGAAWNRLYQHRTTLAKRQVRGSLAAALQGPCCTGMAAVPAGTVVWRGAECRSLLHSAAWAGCGAEWEG